MQFCNSAWFNGYLRRFSQYTSYYYKCVDEDCETCQSVDGTWILYKTITGVIREDFPQ